MNDQRTPRWRWLAGTALLGPALLITACEDSPQATGDPTVPPATATAEPVTEPTAEPSADPGAAAGGGEVDACDLLTEAELSDVFADAVPAPKGSDYGLGYVECVWEESRDQVVRVSLVPAEALRTDFVDQLNVGGEVAELGPDAVWFPGRVGIGAAGGGGATTGFPVEERAVLVAVATGDTQEADLARATELSTLVSQRLG